MSDLVARLRRWSDLTADPLSDLCAHAAGKIECLTTDLAEAERLIARAVELMTPDQVGQWEGVRAWQERESLDGEP